MSAGTARRRGGRVRHLRAFGDVCGEVERVGWGPIAAPIGRDSDTVRDWLGDPHFRERDPISPRPEQISDRSVCVREFEHASGFGGGHEC